MEAIAPPPASVQLKPAKPSGTGTLKSPLVAANVCTVAAAGANGIARPMPIVSARIARTESRRSRGMFGSPILLFMKPSTSGLHGGREQRLLSHCRRSDIEEVTLLNVGSAAH